MFYDAANALLQSVKLCMGGESCPYKFYVSRGIAPADCDSITARYDGGQRNERESDQCSTVYEDSIVLTLTKCCVVVDAEGEFDPALEDAEAKCFYDDLHLIRACINCNGLDDMEPFADGCRPYIERVVSDAMSAGGCFSAQIYISFRNIDCCPPPAVPPVP